MASSFSHSTLRALSTLALVGLLSTNARAADRIEAAPAELAKVDLKERLGAQIPLATTFVNADGKTVRLADLIGTKPVILTFNYSDCPMLCSVQLTGLVNAMREMSWELGEQYEVITISLDPTETRDRAKKTRARYLSDYARGGETNAQSGGWTFLTGSTEKVDAIANAVGFGYTYYPARKQYLHPAVLTLLSPSGTVSTYIYGVTYDSTDLRDKLVVAGVGETSEALAKFILSCYHYDAPTGNGAIVANVMRYGGFVFLVGFAGILALSKRRRHRRALHSEGSYSIANQVGSSDGHV